MVESPRPRTSGATARTPGPPSRPARRGCADGSRISGRSSPDRAAARDRPAQDRLSGEMGQAALPALAEPQLLRPAPGPGPGRGALTGLRRRHRHRGCGGRFGALRGRATRLRGRFRRDRSRHGRTRPGRERASGFGATAGGRPRRARRTGGAAASGSDSVSAGVSNMGTRLGRTRRTGVSGSFRSGRGAEAAGTSGCGGFTSTWANSCQRMLSWARPQVGGGQRGARGPRALNFDHEWSRATALHVERSPGSIRVSISAARTHIG